MPGKGEGGEGGSKRETMRKRGKRCIIIRLMIKLIIIGKNIRKITKLKQWMLSKIRGCMWSAVIDLSSAASEAEIPSESYRRRYVEGGPRSSGAFLSGPRSSPLEPTPLVGLRGDLPDL